MKNIVVFIVALYVREILELKKLNLQNFFAAGLSGVSKKASWEIQSGHDLYKFDMLKNTIHVSYLYFRNCFGQESQQSLERFDNFQSYIKFIFKR